MHRSPKQTNRGQRRKVKKPNMGEGDVQYMGGPESVFVAGNKELSGDSSAVQAAGMAERRRVRATKRRSKDFSLEQQLAR